MPPPTIFDRHRDGVYPAVSLPPRPAKSEPAPKERPSSSGQSK